MIRINLAKMMSSSAQPSSDIFGAASAGISSASASGPAGKIIAILLFPVLLYGWEQSQLSSKKKAVEVKTQQLNAVKSEVEKFGSVTSIVEDLKKERDLLHARLKVIKKISSKRALKIGTLRDLQRVIPKDVWLDKVDFKDGEVFFEGFSRTPSSVQVMAEQLASSEFIVSAIPSELKRTQAGETTLHLFKVVAKVKEL